MKAIAADLAGETVFILNYYDGIDADKADKVIDDLVNLLTDKLGNVSVMFDKTPKESFSGDNKAYRKARRTYFRACYGELMKEFNDGIADILKDMNGLLSKEQLEANKKMAAK